MSAVIDLLASLVEIDSVNPAHGGPGEANVAAFVAKWFGRRGIETFRQEVLPGRENVVAVLPGRNRSRRVVFEAHMDTVSAAGMTIDPFTPTVRDGRLYGRGACDTKGGLAAMMQAVADVHAARQIPPGDVWMAAVVDEEHAFQGVSRLVAGLAAEAAVVAEPTDLRIVAATKGVLRFAIEVHGVAAHSSKPHLGINAISHAALLVQALDALHATLAATSHPLLGPATGAVTMISGGVQINVVPERCSLAIDRRLIPGETPDGVLAGYQRVIDALVGEHAGFRATIQPPALVDGPLDTPADAAAVVAALGVSADLGLGQRVEGVPYGSDASKFARHGVPAFVFGPGSIDQAHAAVEYVATEAVERATAFYRMYMQRFPAA
jgi:acetylornithine deacetylase/succinyl-diaminopimelate desuccinylase family protein